MTQAAIPTARGYDALRHDLVRLGFFDPQPRYYLAKALSVAALFGGGLFFALWFESLAIVLASAVVLGVANVQAEMFGHDVGHRQTLRSPRLMGLAGLLFGNLLLALSYTYWIDKHSRHHAFPNDPEKDPDGDYSVLALTHAQIATRRWAFRPLIAVQALLFPFWLLLQPYTMRLAGLLHLHRNQVRDRGAQAAALVLHAVGYGVVLYALGDWTTALLFVAVHQSVMGLYNGMVFAPNHKGMAEPETGAAMSFLQRQTITARNVRGSPVTDWMFGGLNYQIEHHLFPTMPRNRLREAQPHVQALCRARGISYRSVSVVQAYTDLFVHLHRVSAPLRSLGWTFRHPEPEPRPS